MWLLAKPLSILITILITWLWMYLIEIHTWWSYLLAFFPTIICYILIIVNWFMDKFNNINNDDDLTNFGTIIVIILMVIPIVGISLIITIYGFAGIRFPNKYDLESLEQDSIIKTFKSMQG
jgi:hypothetical protein